MDSGVGVAVGATAAETILRWSFGCIEGRFRSLLGDLGSLGSLGVAWGSFAVLWASFECRVGFFEGALGAQMEANAIQKPLLKNIKKT